MSHWPARKRVRRSRIKTRQDKTKTQTTPKRDEKKQDNTRTKTNPNPNPNTTQGCVRGVFFTRKLEADERGIRKGQDTTRQR